MLTSFGITELKGLTATFINTSLPSLFFNMWVDGKLVLSDGTEFRGISFGAEHSIAGEVVFNTGMVGYPEAMTDPSYKGQILALTYPLIGNYGVPPLYGIDTRGLTKMLREKGAMLGKVVIGKDVEFYDPNADDLVAQVSIGKPVRYAPVEGHPLNAIGKSGGKSPRIILVDCGMKNNMVTCLTQRGATVLRVPYDYDFTKEQYDGLFISNGPGDPKMCTKAIAHTKKALEVGKPIFGVCLGNQILALAAGGDTYKLKNGHRSQNQPCIQQGTKRCFITTQNHGFAVDMKSLDGQWEEYFINANDGTNEGIRHRTKPFRSVQFHPEARPGPVDAEILFDDFMRMVGP